VWLQGSHGQGLHDGDGDATDGADGNGDYASSDESCSYDFLHVLLQYYDDADDAADDGAVVGRRDSCGVDEGVG